LIPALPGLIHGLPGLIPGPAGIDPRQLAELLIAARAAQNQAQSQASAATGLPGQVSPPLPITGLPGQMSSPLPQTQPQALPQSPSALLPQQPQRVLPLTMSDFLPAISNVIDVHEGGFQNRADDPGNFTPTGEQRGTKYGISAAAYPNEDIKNLTKQRAGELFQKDYGMFSALADQRVMTKILDLAVNMQKGGSGPATKILQQAINASGVRVPVDGKFGIKTADAANSIDPNVLLKAIIEQSQAQYAKIEAANPGMKAWFKGRDQRALWQPPDNSSRVPRSNAPAQWDADRAMSDRDRADVIRFIRNSLAGLSDQPAQAASQTNAAPQQKVAGPQSNNTPQSKAEAVKQVQKKKKN
jgi:lysozyme family protein